jgi:hypothetical protein
MVLEPRCDIPTLDQGRYMPVNSSGVASSDAAWHPHREKPEGFTPQPS